MTDAQKQEIIDNILKEVNIKGSARVGFHIDAVIGKENSKPIPYNIKSKIEGSITSSKKYRSRLHPNFKNDFEILKNPDYSEKTWVEKNPIANNFLVGGITAAFSLLVGWLLLQVPNSKEEKQIQNLEVNINQLKDSVAVLKKTIFYLQKATLPDSISITKNTIKSKR